MASNNSDVLFTTQTTTELSSGGDGDTVLGGIPWPWPITEVPSEPLQNASLTE